MTELAAPESALELGGILVNGPSLELATILVNGLERGRLVALGLAADLDISHGLALSRDLSGVIGNAAALARDLADARDLAPIVYGDRDLANALGDAGARARDLTEGLTDARARDRATRADPLDLAVPTGRALAGARAYVGARDRARISARGLASNLTVSRDFAGALAGALAKAFIAPRDLADAAEQARPTRPAVRVAWTAAGLLPRRARARYGEEYRCELAELAAAGAGRLVQLRYAVCLLARVPQLRAAVAGARQRREAAR